MKDTFKFERPRNVQSAWSTINAKAPYKRSTSKRGRTPFRSSVQRHPEEKRAGLNWERKAASEARIAKYQAAERRYRLLVENPTCKVQSQKGVNFIQPRGEKGQFLSRIVL